MKRFCNKILVCIVVIVLMFLGNGQVEAKSVLDEVKTEEYLDALSESQMSAFPNPLYGSVGGDWLVMALARYGSIDKNYKEKYINNLKETLDNNKGILSTRKYTEYSRVILAVTSLGENAANFKGYNLVKPLAEYDKVISQGANGIVYALIALDSGGYDIPSLSEDSSSQKTTREKLINAILKAQLDDGGWSISGKKSDSDLTAMAIQALVPYINKNDYVKKAVDKGLNTLGNLQLSNGGYAATGTGSCESTAQVLTAMSEAGVSITDERFVKNGNTVLDGLMAYYKNGGFSHLAGGKENSMATEQGMYALVSYYRKITKKNRLYDMSDGLVYRVTDQDKNVEANEKETDAMNHTNSSENVDHSNTKDTVLGGKNSESKSNRKSNNKGNSQTEKNTSKNKIVKDVEDSTGISNEKKENEVETKDKSSENDAGKKDINVTNHTNMAEENIEDIENGILMNAEESANMEEKKASDTYEGKKENNGINIVVIIMIVLVAGIASVVIYDKKYCKKIKTESDHEK